MLAQGMTGGVGETIPAGLGVAEVVLVLVVSGDAAALCAAVIWVESRKDPVDQV